MCDVLPSGTLRQSSEHCCSFNKEWWLCPDRTGPDRPEQTGTDWDPTFDPAYQLDVVAEQISYPS